METNSSSCSYTVDSLVISPSEWSRCVRPDLARESGFATSTLLSKTLTGLVCAWEVGDKAALGQNRSLCEEGCVSSGRKAKTQTRGPQPMWSWWRWHDRVLTISSYSTLDAAIELSYAAFVRGETYTDSIRMPDETRLHHANQDGLSAEDQRDTLSEAWDEWLVRHSEQRAELDTEPRATRLQA